MRGVVTVALRIVWLSGASLPDRRHRGVVLLRDRRAPINQRDRREEGCISRTREVCEGRTRAIHAATGSSEVAMIPWIQTRDCTSNRDHASDQEARFAFGKTAGIGLRKRGVRWYHQVYGSAGPLGTRSRLR